MILDDPTRRTVAATTRFGDVRELDEVGSTNRYLLDLARGGAPEGVVVVADFQSAGRGRLDRTWEAPPGGALLVSILLRPDPDDVAPDRRWLVTAAVALAAADACQSLGVPVGGPGAAGVEIKWPNDLLLGGRKLAGILAEADGDAIVVGVGINVAWAPQGAASLGSSVDRGRLLAALLANLEGWCGRWGAVAAAYAGRCATVGRTVRVELPGGIVVVGAAEAVEADGALRITVDGAPMTVRFGDVFHVTDR